MDEPNEVLEVVDQDIQLYKEHLFMDFEYANSYLIWFSQLTKEQIIDYNGHILKSFNPNIEIKSKNEELTNILQMSIIFLFVYCYFFVCIGLNMM